MCQSGCKAAIVFVSFFVVGGKYFTCFCKFSLDVCLHLLFAESGQNFLRHRIFECFQVGNGDWAVEIVEKICQPSSAHTKFGNILLFEGVIHFNIVQPVDSQSHFADIVHIGVALNGQPATGAGYLESIPVGIVDVVPPPVAHSVIACLVADDLYACCYIEQTSVTTIFKGGVCGRRCDSISVFCRFGEDIGIDITIVLGDEFARSVQSCDEAASESKIYKFCNSFHVQFFLGLFRMKYLLRC